MDTDTSACRETLVTERTTLIGVDRLALSQELVDLIAEDLINQFVLGRDATAIHRTVFGLTNDIVSTRHTPRCVAQSASRLVDTSSTYDSPSRAGRDHYYALVAAQKINNCSQIPLHLFEEVRICSLNDV